MNTEVGTGVSVVAIATPWWRLVGWETSKEAGGVGQGGGEGKGPPPSLPPSYTHTHTHMHTQWLIPHWEEKMVLMWEGLYNWDV